VGIWVLSYEHNEYFTEIVEGLEKSLFDTFSLTKLTFQDPVSARCIVQKWTGRGLPETNGTAFEQDTE
jgi:hypothetical protein